MTQNKSSLEAFANQYRNLLESYLSETLTDSLETVRLFQAMRYALLNGGKRVRPLLLFATIDATGGNPETGLPAAAALEMIHSYSLIHDDLPAMDDDTLRRGKPTCHIAFDEATAILAGDGLQSYAFELLSNQEQYSVETRLKLIQTLCRASGIFGMVAGQAIDLDFTGKKIDLTTIEQMHLRKTGALIQASVLMGAYCNKVIDQSTLSKLQDYAKALGLAFQVRDDIIDVESDTSTLGKTQGKDAANNKPTYTSILGMDGAKQKAIQLKEEALDNLEQIGLGQSYLAEIANFIINRQS